MRLFLDKASVAVLCVPGRCSAMKSKWYKAALDSLSSVLRNTRHNQVHEKGILCRPAPDNNNHGHVVCPEADTFLVPGRVPHGSCNYNRHQLFYSNVGSMPAPWPL